MKKSICSAEISDDRELDHECTSWMVFNDLTKNNTHILHKNRDSSKTRKIAVLLSPADSARKWIALGSGNANMGMNASGLAGVMNSGEICADHSTDKSKKTTPVIMRDILGCCDTAAQAVKKLKEFIDAGDYCHADKGSIFFFLDTSEGYVCELTPAVFTVQDYHNGYAVRANIWKNPGMHFYSRNSVKRYLDSSGREYIAFTGLNKVLDENGKITVQDVFDLSRHCTMPEESSEKRSLCFKNTNSTATLEIDREYPGVLSTMYATIGHPRHTVYVPVPICAETILPEMGDYSWSDAVFKDYGEVYDAEIPEEWLKFEQDYQCKFAAVKDEARKLLNAGKRDEAVKLVNDAAYAIWCDAAALLKIR